MEKDVQRPLLLPITYTGNLVSQFSSLVQLVPDDFLNFSIPHMISGGSSSELPLSIILLKLSNEISDIVCVPLNFIIRAALFIIRFILFCHQVLTSCFVV